MLAALPMRKVDEPVAKRQYRNTLQRSKGMLARFFPMNFVNNVHDSGNLVKRNEFFSRISNVGVVTDFNRSILVQHTSLLMHHVGRVRRCYIPTGWFDSIWRLIFYMTEVTEKADFNEGDWLPEFPFQIPRYDPETFSTWSEQSDRWEHVGPPEDPDSPSKAIPQALWGFSQ
ncbi:hypothetical protein F4680DRAFT_165412 [Xylaria scruposa]|nr:hypothetical protein F4680DRAFT_165412 [Xylaria scruposa]